ncbi:MAG: GTPase RsgA, partial [Ilumatobacter fluminis]
MEPDRSLGWNDALDASWQSIGAPGVPGRVSRIDRGWSSVMRHADDTELLRVRNLFVDVAVGDWVVPSDDGERVDHIIERTSAFTRRASHEGDRFEADVLAANIDVVFLVHAFGSPPNQRRLERELVLAYDSGAEPVVVLTKVDLVA